MGEYEIPRRVHIVGVAGAGMSALAKLLAGNDHEVSGSDLRGGALLADLTDHGIPVWSGHAVDRLDNVELVVASSAVPDSDPEVTAARAMGIAVWRRPDLLAALTKNVPTIGATGTHGKTTTTGMLISACKAVGLDPSFVIGGDLVEYRTNAVVGSDDLLVLEVDEAFGTFEVVTLTGLVVTNVEADHLDHFRTLDALQRAFERVVRGVDGPVVVCADDPGAKRLAEVTGAVTYGTDPSARWHVDRTGPGKFTLSGGGVSLDATAPRLGEHMTLNTAGAIALMAELGHDPVPVARGIAGYQGVSRRFERKGTVAGVTVVDDYAHHPTEIAATLAEARLVTLGRVVALFQPHLYSRTETLRVEFGQALASADMVFVTDIYGSRETPRPGVTGAVVVAATVEAGGRDVRYVPHMADLAGKVVPELIDGDMVVVLGAGDITVVSTEILLALDDRLRL